MNRPSQAAPTNRRPQTDLLELRDRNDLVPVTPLHVTSGAVVCVAGCGAGSTNAVAVLPSKSSSTLAVVGPIEDAKLIKAALTVPTPAEAPSLGDVGVITCLAGCDASDRRIMRATGGPATEMPSRSITAAAAVLTPTPRPKAPSKVATAPVASVKVAPDKVAAVKLKRTHSAHAKRVDKRTKTAARKPSAVQVAQAVKPALPQIAAVGVPSPIQPAQPNQKPQPVVAKPQPVVSPKRPVSVNTSSDWFNKISREQAAKKKDDAAQ